MPFLDEPSLLRECGVERTPLQLRRWVDDQLQRIGSNRQGRSAIRLRKGAMKQFIEEVYPLSLWAGRFFGNREDVKCKWIDGNQSFDAIITDFSKSPLHEFRLEITMASDSYEEHLRMEYADRRGGVPMTGPSTRGKVKDDRRIDAHFKAESHGALIAKAYRQVGEAIRRKVAKRYSVGTSLLVMVEDCYFELVSDTDDLKAVALDAMGKGQTTFDVVFILGFKQKIAFAVSAPGENFEF
jgi:hypothetical protein